MKMLISGKDGESFLWVHRFDMTFGNLNFAYTFRKFTPKAYVLPIPFANLHQNHAFCIYLSQIYVKIMCFAYTFSQIYTKSMHIAYTFRKFT